jgi:spore maturation protein SpmB
VLADAQAGPSECEVPERARSESNTHLSLVILFNIDTAFLSNMVYSTYSQDYMSGNALGCIDVHAHARALVLWLVLVVQLVSVVSSVR